MLVAPVLKWSNHEYEKEVEKATSFVAVFLVLLSPLEPLFAQPRRSRGSVSGASRGSYSRSGNTASWQSAGGRASGSGSVTRTESGATGSRQTTTESGASREVSREVDKEDNTVEKSSTVTTAQGETASSHDERCRSSRIRRRRLK